MSTLGGEGQERAALALLALCSIAFVRVTREGERFAVDEAAGRPVLLLGLWGLALAAALTLVLSPSSVWRPALGSFTVAQLAGIAGAWGVVVGGFGLVAEYVVEPTAEEVIGALAGWVLVEELLFRGALFDLIDRVVPPGRLDWAVAGTTVLFAVSHLQYHAFDVSESAAQVAWVVPTGLLFGYVRRRSGNIWPSVGLHSLANAVAHLVS